MARRDRDLVSEHSSANIRNRLRHPRGESPLGDFMLGGVDGVVTTFAVVAGSAGGQLTTVIVIILGIANLIADGFSMAVSNYLGTRASQEEVHQSRSDEEWQISEFPQGEMAEIRQIFEKKGFEGATLDEIVAVISADRKVWVDTMMAEELRLSEITKRPARAALTTFIAFSICGAIPLIPFLGSFGTFDEMFRISTILGAATFFILGMGKGWAVGISPLRSGLQTFAVGGAAAALAYAAGHFLHSMFAG